jgi:hypothetical protein
VVSALIWVAVNAAMSSVVSAATAEVLSAAI